MVEHRIDLLILEPVEDVASVAPPFEKAGEGEELELLRGGRERGAGRLDEFVDTAVAFGEETEDLEAFGIGEKREYLGHTDTSLLGREAFKLVAWNLRRPAIGAANRLRVTAHHLSILGSSKTFVKHLL